MMKKRKFYPRQVLRALIKSDHHALSVGQMHAMWYFMASSRKLGKSDYEAAHEGGKALVEAAKRSAPLRMSIDGGKTFRPIQMTEAMREQYKALSLTDDQAKAIIGNATTRIFIKPGQFDAGPDGSRA